LEKVSGIKYQVSGSSEEEIYRSGGLQFIEPELREGLNEIDFARENKIPKLIELTDLKGILHNHSTYSDGMNSLKDMAEYCNELGYEYLGICDHSQSAFYAEGLKPERVFEQHLEIDELNKKLFPFKIFKGIESDILNDGSLDYTEDVLKTFDFIVASVHSNLKMNEEKATARLITAIENPYTTILGHPTGRLLLSRPGYPIDHKKVIDACAANGVVIELNAHPYRLDIDWRWIPYCLEKGVVISINPDAHEKHGYHDMYFGTCAARKGMLTKEMCFNALSLNEMEAHFSKRKK
jgi:DNA polymerase (family 10)